MDELRIKISNLRHREEVSKYNYNYYTNMVESYVLLEKSDDFNTIQYYLVKNNREHFLGCCADNDGIEEGKEWLTIVELNLGGWI